MQPLRRLQSLPAIPLGPYGDAGAGSQSEGSDCEREGDACDEPIPGLGELIRAAREKIDSRFSRCPEGPPARGRAEGWEHELGKSLSTPPFSETEFWAGPDAAMMNLSDLPPGRRDYRGAPLSTINCPDLAAFYASASENAPGKYSTAMLAQVKSVVSQLARFATAVGRFDIRDACNLDSVWKLLEEKDIVEGFLVSLAAAMHPGTCRNKARNLSWTLDVAISRSSSSNEDCISSLQAVKTFVLRYMKDMKELMGQEKLLR